MTFRPLGLFIENQSNGPTVETGGVSSDLGRWHTVNNSTQPLGPKKSGSIRHRRFPYYLPELLAIPACKFRHRDHRFEWTRAEFQEWANGVATRFGYNVRFLPVGPEDSVFGSPTQMGVFERAGYPVAPAESSEEKDQDLPN